MTTTNRERTLEEEVRLTERQRENRYLDCRQDRDDLDGTGPTQMTLAEMLREVATKNNISDYVIDQVFHVVEKLAKRSRDTGHSPQELIDADLSDGVGKIVELIRSTPRKATTMHNESDEQAFKSYAGQTWQRGEDLDAEGKPSQVRRTEREKHYEETADAIRQLPQEGNGTYTTDELNAAARKIVDPLYDLVIAADTKSKGLFPLRDLLGEVIELIVYFPGGHFNVFGRVSIVPATPCLWVGSCRLDVDALVSLNSVGVGFVYDFKEQE